MATGYQQRLPLGERKRSANSGSIWESALQKKRKGLDMWYDNEERELIRNAAREFAENEVQPFVKRMEVDHEYPTELVKRMGELGFNGWIHKEIAGGSEGDWTTYGIILEEISKVSNTLALILVLQTVMCTTAWDLAGTDEQCEKWLKPVFTGEKIMAVSNTEPCGAIQYGEFQSRAYFDEDTNEWVINASKIFTTGAGQADIYVVHALTSDFDPETRKGLSIFVVPADTPGVRPGHIENKLGWNGSSTGSMYYDEVRVPAENLIGEEGMGAIYLDEMSAREVMCFGPMCLGACEGAFEKALAYVKQRNQDGTTLYLGHETVRHTLAKMWLAIETLRGYVYTNLDLKDQGGFTVAECMGQKVIGSEIMQYVGKNAVMICGGQGIVVENGIESTYRDGLVNAIGGASTYTLLDPISLIVTSD